MNHHRHRRRGCPGGGSAAVPWRPGARTLRSHPLMTSKLASYTSLCFRYCFPFNAPRTACCRSCYTNMSSNASARADPWDINRFRTFFLSLGRKRKELIIDSSYYKSSPPPGRPKAGGLRGVWEDLLKMRRIGAFRRMEFAMALYGIRHGIAWNSPGLILIWTLIGDSHVRPCGCVAVYGV